MLAKVFVLAFVAFATCEDHGYTFKAVHEPAQEYRHYEHIPARVHEEPESVREANYNPAHEGLGHTYSSQSLLHHSGLGGQQGSQESNEERVAPVYQYEPEEPEETPIRQAPVHHAPATHYQSIQFSVPAPAHHEHIAVHAQQPHAVHVTKPHHVDPHYPHGHEESSYHGAQLHSVPVHHVPQADVHGHDSHEEIVDYYAYPKYQFEYKVEDPHTGDNKFQHEYRDGDVVKGVYSLQEADGSYRTVEYSSDKHTGFNAIVKHSAPGQHVQIESHHNN